MSPTRLLSLAKVLRLDAAETAIREALFFHDFRDDFKSLARRLQPAITAAEAKKSISLLEGLGFIRKRPDGIFRPTSTTIKKDPAFKAMRFANFMKADIELGMASLESFPKEERDVSTMTLSLSREGNARAKDEIQALREKLLSLTEADERPDRVYKFNFHAFPVTK